MNSKAFAPIPVYTRIEEDLRAKIREGHWAAGTMLPGRNRLAREYGVDLRTLQRAISHLLEDGTLRADNRRGTFVAEGTAESEPTPKESALPGSATLGIVASSLYDSRHFEIGDEWIRTIISSLERVFSAADGTTRFFNRARPGKKDVPLHEAIDTLRGESVDALVLIGIYETPGLIEEVLDCVNNGNLPPTVFISWNALPLPVPCVFYDSELAGYQAAQHLLRIGHKSLLFLEPFVAPWAEQRLAGIRQAMRQAGLPEEALRVYPESKAPDAYQDVVQQEMARDAARALLAGGQIPSAVIGANDRVAFGMRQAAAEAGKAAGVDYALVGFDDAPDARTLGVTSLRPPLEALGEEAARLVLRALGGEETAMQIRLRSHLVPRASTRPLQFTVSPRAAARRNLTLERSQA